MSLTATDGTRRRYRPDAELDLHATLAPHMRGRRDACHRVDASGAHWRTWRTPDGPATLRIAADPVAGEIDVRAWGRGSSWVLDSVPALLGAGDDWSGLALTHQVLRDARKRNAGLRLSSSGRVFEALVPAIIEQLVNGVEARRSWNALVDRFGEPAPGPIPFVLKVFPAASALREIPDWEWHSIGLDGRRRLAVIAAAAVASRIDECDRLDIDTAVRRLTSVPGVGAWTAAETLQRSHGAPDLVSFGDYHLPSMVGHLLTGRPRTDDAGLAELLEPYRPHRQRVVRLVEATGVGAPRYGPRMPVRDNRRR